MSSVSVVKLGPWGGDLGSALDLTVAPQRLESFTVRWGKVIDWIAFSYRDRHGKLHTAGPWGGNGKGEGTQTITLQPSEHVTGVAWSVGPFAFKNVERCITSLKLVTNLGSYGPFGHGVDSTHHDLPVLNGGSVVGMFARAGDFLDAIGFYVLPGGGPPAAAAAAVPAAAPATTTTTTTDPVIKDKREEEKVVNDGSSQEEIMKEDKASPEEKEEKDEKTRQEGKEEKGNSSQEEKENGKS